MLLLALHVYTKGTLGVFRVAHFLADDIPGSLDVQTIQKEKYDIVQQVTKVSEIVQSVAEGWGCRRVRD